jgi:FAD/FMN-containing dehydrogenase
VSEDVGVPVERLGDLLDATARIGAKHSLPTCNWGHAGDGNVHVTFMVDSANGDEFARAEHVAAELFEVATALRGTISGEHGVSAVKRPFAHQQFSPRERDLQQHIKNVFDPKGLLNPGKKLT